MNSTNKDKFYPDEYARIDRLQTYVEKQVEKISDVIVETEKELTDKDFGYFKSELGDYINEI